MKMLINEVEKCSIQGLALEAHRTRTIEVNQGCIVLTKHEELLTMQAWKLALAHSPMQVSKLLGRVPPGDF